MVSTLEQPVACDGGYRQRQHPSPDHPFDNAPFDSAEPFGGADSHDRSGDDMGGGQRDAPMGGELNLVISSKSHLTAI